MTAFECLTVVRVYAGKAAAIIQDFDKRFTGGICAHVIDNKKGSREILLKLRNQSFQRSHATRGGANNNER